MNSKWEEFGSPNRIRTMNLLVNSQSLLVDCHVVHASKVWPLRERGGETAERFSVTSPRARKHDAAVIGRAMRGECYWFMRYVRSRPSGLKDSTESPAFFM